MLRKSVILQVSMLLIAAVTSRAAVSHSAWGAILAKYVKSGRVDYTGLRADSSDVKTLDTYLKTLAVADIMAYSREQQLAFWINAYNAFTVRLILDNFPVKSIKKIKNPWKRKIWPVAGETLSLDDIEHEKLRAQFQEPRIHFAIVCASVGCPDLHNRAFTAQNLESQLHASAMTFFSQEKNLILEVKKGGVILHLSSLMKWFGEDFGENKIQRLAFIQKYLDQKKAARLVSPEKIAIKYIQYDWSLNGH